MRYASSVVLVLLCCCHVAWAGPKGDVTVRGVAPGSISIDGSFSDWPLDQYTKATELPEFPAAQLEFEVDVSGDHIVFDIDRVGFFNGTVAEELTKDGVQDFGSTILYSHDGEFLYVLGSFIDESPRGDRDESEFGDGGFRNDGWEIFFDSLNDTEDDAAANAFPAFDEEEPNLDDMQITFALNDFFLPDDAPENAIGVRQHMERAGTRVLMGPIDPDTGVQTRNAPDEGGESYRAFLDAATASDGNPDIAAIEVADLRAAGAPNPEIAANPDEEFAGYVVEARIPFGIVEGFEPDHNIGMGLFWRDFDNEGDQGGAEQSWMDWTQNTDVRCNEGELLGLFCGSNWGELIFDDVPEGIACDPNSQGDLDGNGRIEFADFLIMSTNFGTDVAGHADGDIDCNGKVEFADFLVLSANFGSSAAAESVPEPSTSVLVLAICVFITHSRRRWV